MTTTPPTEPREAGSKISPQQIAEEHRALGESLSRIGKTTDPHRLLARLEKLRDQLEHHFAGEEGEGGLRDDVVNLAPFLLSTLDKLFEEHREVLVDIEELRAKAQACVDGPLAEILRDATSLVRRMHEHEARESELISDVYYTDYGEGAD